VITVVTSRRDFARRVGGQTNDPTINEATEVATTLSNKIIIVPLMVLSLYNWHEVVHGQHANKDSVHTVLQLKNKYTHFLSDGVCCGVIRLFITTTEQLYTSYNSFR